MDFLNVLLNEYFQLGHFVVHLVEKSLFTRFIDIQNCLFKSSNARNKFLVVIIQHNHAFTVLLRHFNHRLKQVLDYVSHADLEVEPHELISWRVLLLCWHIGL
jgi:hypothetical protein